MFAEALSFSAWPFAPAICTETSANLPAPCDLSQAGADPVLADRGGRTALICAVHSRTDDTAYMLRDLLDHINPEAWRDAVNARDRQGTAVG